ncbi:hypothetical protein CO2235_MP30014 [Cupriavidus oxalaticus]|uniref:Uncharacterized protein n=1 Tax=Cupriavidus oxalaticus TaxID=96344 RepID=A0A375GIF5_9BURK|nr:hypothetical protein CO2235_MP30014 [Cupriavidus oxalaticus]
MTPTCYRDVKIEQHLGMATSLTSLVTRTQSNVFSARSYNQRCCHQGGSSAAVQTP